MFAKRTMHHFIYRLTFFFCVKIFGLKIWLVNPYTLGYSFVRRKKYKDVSVAKLIISRQSDYTSDYTRTSLCSIAQLDGEKEIVETRALQEL